MKIIGITGGIASGKNLISFYLKQLYYPIFDADAFVHYLYQHDTEVINKISHIFPLSLHDNIINRKRLSDYLIEDQSNWCKLESIVHPLVVRKIYWFIKQYRRLHFRNIVLNIPLLFEIKADKLCDRIVVVNSNSSVRTQRLAKRENYNHALARVILSKQHNIVKGMNYKIIKTGIAKDQIRNSLYHAIMN